MLHLFQKFDKEIASLHKEVKQDLYSLAQALLLLSVVSDQSKWEVLCVAHAVDRTYILKKILPKSLQHNGLPE